ncbi:DUF2158 domain-containing protein [Spirosoma sp. SC4-14]|uniref:YodC family protein n=1 Tax=Spirosoma sp. SC4-14 TaxID=3128900 RepID=UPI0030D57F24
MPSIKIGDKVRLKSGGPIMTVTHFNDLTGIFTCQWFMNGKLELGYFPEESLEKVVDDSSASPGIFVG